MDNKKYHIAIMGTRGVPASYGGFETFAEELGKRLVRDGYKVTVFGRKPFFKKYMGRKEYLGINIKVCPTIMHKYLETPLSALTSFLSLFFIKNKPDVILLCNAANSPFAFLIKFLKIPLLINVDGVERERKKWNALGKFWYLLGEKASVKFASRVISDAKVIQDYYKERYNKESVVIPYGADPVMPTNDDTLKFFNLKKNNYILYVSRLEPENNALGVIEAYVKLKTNIPLVIVGDAPYSREYKEKLKAIANEKVIFTGYQFGDAYRQFREGAKIYIQATEVGGTHPALVEAMGHGNCIIANTVPEHIEVLEDAGMYYPKNDFEALSSILKELLNDEEKINKYKELSKALAIKKYSWDSVTKLYEDNFLDFIK